MYRILVRVDVEFRRPMTMLPASGLCINCVSQSNSKSAREERNEFFRACYRIRINTIGIDTSQNENPTLADVMRFYKQTNNDLKLVGTYHVLDPDQLSPFTE